MINTEKQSIENSISKIETEKSLMLENISQELNKLEKIVSLNDIKNMNSYIFMDKGKNITQSLNKALKVVNLIKEIRGIPLLISSIDINSGTVKFSGLDVENTVSGEIKLEDIPKKITNILDRPRNAPFRTAAGVAGIIYYSVLMIAASSDLIATHFHVSLNDVAICFINSSTVNSPAL